MVRNVSQQHPIQVRKIILFQKYVRMECIIDLWLIGIPRVRYGMHTHIYSIGLRGCINGIFSIKHLVVVIVVVVVVVVCIWRMGG